MRKVKAWLVTEVSDLIDTLVECPVIAFQDRDAAELYAKRGDGLAEGADDLTWNQISEIEVVLDD